MIKRAPTVLETLLLLVTLVFFVWTVISAADADNAKRDLTDALHEVASLRAQLAFMEEHPKTIVIETPVERLEPKVEAPKVETRDVTVDYVPDGSVLLGTFRVSHYDTGACCCNPADGITASGRKAVAGYSVAVDPKVVPLGTLLLIDYGDGVLHEARADDTGSAVKGNKIDLCVEDHATAVQLGVRSATVYAVREASK